MITDSRMTAFINSLDHGNTPFLDRLEQQARKERVPVIRRETQSFLKTILEMQKPGSVLEIGTAVGFSAILMAGATAPECRITTIEDYEKRIPVAQKNFRESGYADRITLLKGDAADVLKTLSDPFDFIFLDAAKAQYIRYLPDLLHLMRPGSVLVSDNVLQGGDIIESHYAVERRNRTIYRRMREYLRALKDSDVLETSILPLGDGVTISVYKSGYRANMENSVSG